MRDILESIEKLQIKRSTTEHLTQGIINVLGIVAKARQNTSKQINDSTSNLSDIAMNSPKSPLSSRNSDADMTNANANAALEQSMHININNNHSSSTKSFKDILGSLSFFLIYIYMHIYIYIYINLCYITEILYDRSEF